MSEKFNFKINWKNVRDYTIFCTPISLALGFGNIWGMLLYLLGLAIAFGYSIYWNFDAFDKLPPYPNLDMDTGVKMWAANRLFVDDDLIEDLSLFPAHDSTSDECELVVQLKGEDDERVIVLDDDDMLSLMEEIIEYQ